MPGTTFTPPPPRRAGSRPNGRRLASLVTLLAFGVAPRPATACSLVPTTRIPVARPAYVAFTGRATADTVAAGTGGLTYTYAPGHFGVSTSAGSVYGQVVRVHRLAPNAPPAIGAAVRRAGGRVVLVPWDYDASCDPVPWARSARWLPDGVGGYFEARLRERAHWVGDVPTLDVFAPQFTPYTATRVGSGAASPAVTPVTPEVLTPDELLDVRATLPTDRALRGDVDSAYAPLRAWAAAHPALAARAPLRELLQAASARAAYDRFVHRPVPLAGTYRVTVWLADTARTAPGVSVGDSSTFYVRTAAHPSSPAGGMGTWPGMYVLTCATTTEAALPTMRPWGGCAAASGPAAEGYVAVSDTVWTDGPGRRVRGGSIDVVVADAAFAARVRRILDARLGFGPFDDARRRPTPDAGDPRRFLPGAFTEAADGRVTFAWAYGTTGTPALRVTAERVSAVVLGAPPDGVER